MRGQLCAVRCLSSALSPKQQIRNLCAMIGVRAEEHRLAPNGGFQEIMTTDGHEGAAYERGDGVAIHRRQFPPRIENDDPWALWWNTTAQQQTSPNDCESQRDSDH